MGQPYFVGTTITMRFSVLMTIVSVSGVTGYASFGPYNAWIEVLSIWGGKDFIRPLR
jgi:hypothetical protein